MLVMKSVNKSTSHYTSAVPKDLVYTKASQDALRVIAGATIGNYVSWQGTDLSTFYDTDASGNIVIRGINLPKGWWQQYQSYYGITLPKSEPAWAVTSGRYLGGGATANTMFAVLPKGTYTVVAILTVIEGSGGEYSYTTGWAMEVGEVEVT